MAREIQPSGDVGWLEASGLLHIFRILGVAVHPAKLVIGLLAILATCLVGWALDGVWTGAHRGVDEQAITRYISAAELDQPYESQRGEAGIFEVWREHERRCVLGLMGSSLPGVSVAAGTPVGRYVEAHSRARPLRNLVGMVHGVWWMFRYHSVYFAVFGLAALLIWSLSGGAITRIAAMQWTRDEKLSGREGLRFARQKLIGGFFLSPCIPLVFVLITVILLVLGGLVLRIPVLGDLLAGAGFVFAILGGFVISVLLLGLCVGGSLFWPAVAVEGSDAFDAFSRGMSYPLSKPWKAIWYAVITVVYASLCWVFVNLFTFFMLTITRTVVGFGAKDKIGRLWPLSGPNALYDWPSAQELASYEYISAFFVGVYVLTVVGLMWSFLASFYFSGSTLIYLLLRRDVDGISLDEVFAEESDLAVTAGAAPAASSTPRASSATPEAGIPLPVVDSGAAPAASSTPRDSSTTPEAGISLPVVDSGAVPPVGSTEKYVAPSVGKPDAMSETEHSSSEPTVADESAPASGESTPPPGTDRAADPDSQPRGTGDAV